MFPHVARDGLQRYTPDGAAIVSGLAAAFRDDFTGDAINPDNWVITVGNGMTTSVAASELTIAAGGVAGAETVLTSKFALTVPCKCEFGLRLSQRIVNQEVRLELVNAAGDMAAYIVFDGVTATSAKIGNINGSLGLADAAWPGQTATTGEQLFELQLYASEVWYASRAVDTIAGRQAAACRSRHVPDPSDSYFIRLRVINTGVPASNTNVAIGSIGAQDINEVFAEISGANPINAVGMAMPVLISSSVALVVSGTVSAQVLGGHYQDTITSLGASATFTGTSRDAAAVLAKKTFNACAFANQSGTLLIEMSNDNATWCTAKKQAVVANEPVELSALIVTRYYRVKFINNAVAQTQFMLNSALHSI